MNESAFEIILDECLDAVLSGKRTIADCLAQYPDFADELKPALQVGLLAARLKKPAMDVASVSALEMRLRGQMLSQERAAARTRWAPLGKLAAMVAIVFLCALGVGGGAVAASANSLPGDPLYGLKRLWEAIILALSSLFDQTTDDVWLHLAQARLDEAEDLAVGGILYRDVLVDLYEATTQAMTLADEETAPRVLAFLSAAEGRLEVLPTTAATEPVRADLLVLVIRGQDDTRLTPASGTPPGLENASPVPSPTVSSTPAATSTPLPTNTHMPTQTATPTFTPTSRVPITPTRTPSPTVTPTPTITPSRTPTSTWTPLPLPVLPTSDGVRPATQESGSRPAPTNVLLTSDATVRYRDTQAAVYATQTAQAQNETEEPGP